MKKSNSKSQIFHLQQSNLMEMESGLKMFTQTNKPCFSTKLILTYLSALFLLLILFHIQTSPFTSLSSPASTPWSFFHQWKSSDHRSKVVETLTDRLRDSVTFLPLKDLRFAETTMTGNTWFMSSLNDSHDEDGSEYLYFPSPAAKGRILCIKGRNARDGTKNSYALAWCHGPTPLEPCKATRDTWPESIPNSATLILGLTYVSDTYYNYDNLWHGLCTVAPFVSWLVKNQCLKPTRWVLFHWGEMRTKMGSWVENLLKANYGIGGVVVDRFEGGDGPYCFEKAVVMRHGLGRMGEERKMEVFELLTCKAREVCGLKMMGRGNEQNGIPLTRLTLTRLTLLMRRGSRAFKNGTTVADVFAKECARIKGCILSVVQSEDLSFCDQVRVMTNTDIVASPHGAQLTNMLFMDRGSSIMEFFPKGWLEHAGNCKLELKIETKVLKGLLEACLASRLSPGGDSEEGMENGKLMKAVTGARILNSRSSGVTGARAWKSCSQYFVLFLSQLERGNLRSSGTLCLTLERMSSAQSSVNFTYLALLTVLKYARAVYRHQTAARSVGVKLQFCQANLCASLRGSEPVKLRLWGVLAFPLLFYFVNCRLLPYCLIAAFGNLGLLAGYSAKPIGASLGRDMPPL
ncbi:hypothetical protein HYC85_008198 [Camellia sinensis]|uniref:Glycosyltransferase 61 catalytic domain-containing protein n=1 Tax=Camellia sinensis TaxID=4442 RepID=A0A7J7HR48_CAMSI|nr:hypothetical protein HYC85_008198 [Camellia sinensis]